MNIAVAVDRVSYRYNTLEALKEVSFKIYSGERFALLGPNGGGKSTLFNLMSTLIPIQKGELTVFGASVRHPKEVRSQLGVVFQEPALDLKLKVAENLWHQGHLYGLSGGILRKRMDETLEHFGLRARAKDYVQELSGGLRRRLDLAKALLHGPKLVLMDEPTNGLDPAVRRELWSHLERLQEATGLSIVFTTHLMEEADSCHRIVLLDEGRKIAEGTPSSLKQTLGKQVVAIRTERGIDLQKKLQAALGLDFELVPGGIRVSFEEQTPVAQELFSSFSEEFESLTIGKPTLEDFFIEKTGKPFEVRP